MAGRCKFVAPNMVRLFLADVHRRAHERLTTKGVEVKPGIFRSAKPDEIAQSAASVRQAESDGDWLDVKKELNAGETRAIFTDLVVDFRAGESATLDPKQVGLTKALQYIVGWSFVDAQGQGVPFSASALNNLYPETYQEIIDAIEAHDESVDRARTERKNSPASVIASAPTS